MTEDKRLLEEIQDLSKYLDGIPVDLRSRGIFDAYDARLNMLQQQLLVARLQKALKPYGEDLNKLPIEISAVGLTDPQFLRHLTNECYNIEQSHHQAAQRYTKTREWINFIVLLSSVSVGLGISVGAFAGAIIWAVLLSMLIAALTTIEITIDLVRRPLKEQMLSDRLAAMRLELEMFSARSNEMRLEDKDVNELTTRLVRLLSEPASDIEAKANDPKDKAINSLNQ